MKNTSDRDSGGGSRKSLGGLKVVVLITYIANYIAYGLAMYIR